jgi:hypothetical protein
MLFFRAANGFQARAMKPAQVLVAAIAAASFAAAAHAEPDRLGLTLSPQMVV